MMQTNPANSLNAICAYYTMYPLDFPLRVLRGARGTNQWVLDPFCGRGTTNFAARLLGMPTVGLDSNPVAVAIAQAKLAHTTVSKVVSCASLLLDEEDGANTPRGAFWHSAYHPQTLKDLCRLRAALLKDCRSDTRIVLRAIILGALHGPVARERSSYFSNQAPRTFAPKPRYSVQFWRDNGLKPRKVDVLSVIRVRAERYLASRLPKVDGYVAQHDSRKIDSLHGIRPTWIVTSPPYYGMRTYVPDQWLRYWFLGGPPYVEYDQRPDDLSHRSREVFTADLRTIWSRLSDLAAPDATLVVRFGAINDRKVDPRAILRDSLRDSGWKLAAIRHAGSAANGKRQAGQFGSVESQAPQEYDFYARLR